VQAHPHPGPASLGSQRRRVTAKQSLRPARPATRTPSPARSPGIRAAHRADAAVLELVLHRHTCSDPRRSCTTSTPAISNSSSSSTRAAAGLALNYDRSLLHDGSAHDRLAPLLQGNDWDYLTTVRQDRRGHRCLTSSTTSHSPTRPMLAERLLGRGADARSTYRAQARRPANHDSTGRPLQPGDGCLLGSATPRWAVSLRMPTCPRCCCRPSRPPEPSGRDDSSRLHCRRRLWIPPGWFAAGSVRPTPAYLRPWSARTSGGFELADPASQGRRHRTEALGVVHAQRVGPDGSRPEGRRTTGRVLDCRNVNPDGSIPTSSTQPSLAHAWSTASERRALLVAVLCLGARPPVSAGLSPPGRWRQQPGDLSLRQLRAGAHFRTARWRSDHGPAPATT